jgi:hypothetical protein
LGGGCGGLGVVGGGDLRAHVLSSLVCYVPLLVVECSCFVRLVLLCFLHPVRLPPANSCLVLSCLVMSWLVLFCLVLSCLALFSIVSFCFP